VLYRKIFLYTGPGGPLGFKVVSIRVNENAD